MYLLIFFIYFQGDSDSSVIESGNTEDNYDEGSGEYDDDYDYEGNMSCRNAKVTFQVREAAKKKFFS